MSASTNLLLKQLTIDVQNIKKQLASLQMQPTKEIVALHNGSETVLRVPLYANSYFDVTESSAFGKIQDGVLYQYPYKYPIITDQRDDCIELVSVPESQSQYNYDNGVCTIKDPTAVMTSTPLLAYNGTKVTKYLFQGGKFNLKTIDKICNMDVSNIDDMSYMFYRIGAHRNNTDGWKNSDYTWNLHFDTRNVKNMAHMFENIDYEKSFLYDAGIFDVSEFNTKNVTDMSYMFANIPNSVDITGFTNFNTRNVTDMSYMFYNSNGIFSGGPYYGVLDLRWLNIDKLENFDHMLDVRGNGTQYLVSIICTEDIADWIKNNAETLGIGGTSDNWTYDDGQQKLTYREI